METTANGHWKSILKRLPDRDVLELRDQVVEMQKLPGWERIVAYIAAGHGAVLRSLTSGPTRDHATQSRTIGYLAGLEEAPSVAKTIVEFAAQLESRLEKQAAADRTARQIGEV